MNGGGGLKLGKGEEWERPVEIGSVKSVLDWVADRAMGVPVQILFLGA